MPNEIQKYRVFIASPQGLTQERNLFKKVLSEYNDSEAIHRGCYFHPIGWEITLGGVGRPQDKINHELESCDYMVLVLWDRWGSPTGSNQNYTSGTEEEYEFAKQCLDDKNKCMSDIIILFKTVDPRQLSDPGDQLKKVLAFKKRIEQSKSNFFETFDTDELFSKTLRDHLAKWTREHERQIGKKSSSRTNLSIIKDKEDHSVHPLDTAILFEDEFQKTTESIQTNLEKIWRRGNLTDTEENLARKILSQKNISDFYEYGLFLMNGGRHADAIIVFTSMYKFSLETNNISWAATAMARIGGIYRIQRKFFDAGNALKESIKLKQKAHDIKGEMSAQIWYGDLMYQLNHNEESLQAYTRAQELSKAQKNKKIQADITFKVAKCERRLGFVERSLKNAEIANKIYQELDLKIQMKAVKQWRRSKSTAKGISDNKI